MNEQAHNKLDSNFVVTRWLRAAAPLDEAQAQRAIEAIVELDGVGAVVAPGGRHNRLRVTYDASRIGFDALRKVLQDAGVNPASGPWSRLRSAWFNYLDTNAQANAGSTGGNCCSNPSDVYASRKHK